MIALLLAPALAAAAPTPHAVPTLAQAGAPDQVPAETWELDQLRIARTIDPAKLKALEDDHSIEAAIQTLTRLGIPFTRLSARMVPGNLPESIRAQIATVPPGEPFVLPESDFISINVIVGHKLPPGSASFHPAGPHNFAVLQDA